MPRNVEIKARIESVELLLPRAAALASEGPFLIDQDDTFFQAAEGRLKLRGFPDGTGELIYYRRADETGPKESHYLIVRVPAPDSMREILALAYGEAGRVRKRRILYLAGRTRIHLDRVEGLGDFLELEVVLAEGEPSEAGMETARELLTQLGVPRDQLIREAYVDLLRSPAPPGGL